MNNQRFGSTVGKRFSATLADKSRRLILLLFWAAIPVTAQQGIADEPLSRQERFNAVKKEYTTEQRAGMIKYQTRMLEIRRELQKAGRSPSDITGEEDQKYRAELMKYFPDRAAFGKKVATILNEDPSDDVGFACAEWIFSNGIAGEPMIAAGKAVLNHHLTREELGRLSSAFTLLPPKHAVRILTVVVEKSPHRSVQGAALVAHARFYRQLADTARYLNDPSMAEWAKSRITSYSPEFIERLKETDPEQIEQSADGLLERAVKDYADVKLQNKTVGEIAGAILFERNQLAIGKPAPEIEGEDTDGVAFKLSDYKGKVVVLDFWGHW